MLPPRTPRWQFRASKGSGVSWIADDWIDRGEYASGVQRHVAQARPDGVGPRVGDCRIGRSCASTLGRQIGAIAYTGQFYPTAARADGGTGQRSLDGHSAQLSRVCVRTPTLGSDRCICLRCLRYQAIGLELDGSLVKDICPHL